MSAADDRASRPAFLRATPHRPVRTLTPGRVDYATAWDWQRRLGARRAAGEIGDTLLLLEHPPVYTLGRRGEESDVLLGAAERARRGIGLCHADRGGQVTYHGPGQLVGYPILRLADRRVADYVRALEEVNLRVAARFGLRAHRRPGAPGVWVGDDKLTAVGARVLAERITRHGWATNVTTDLDAFAGIVPCGDPDRGACSLASRGVDPDWSAVVAATITSFGEVFRCSLEAADRAELGLADAPAGAPDRRRRYPPPHLPAARRR